MHRSQQQSCSLCLPLVPLAVQSVAPQLFAASLLPYLVFLGFLTSSGKTPRITLIGTRLMLQWRPVAWHTPAFVHACACLP
jgi:hypothetical protein